MVSLLLTRLVPVWRSNLGLKCARLTSNASISGASSPSALGFSKPNKLWSTTDPTDPTDMRNTSQRANNHTSNPTSYPTSKPQKKPINSNPAAGSDLLRARKFPLQPSQFISSAAKPVPNAPAKKKKPAAAEGGFKKKPKVIQSPPRVPESMPERPATAYGLWLLEKGYSPRRISSSILEAPLQKNISVEAIEKYKEEWGQIAPLEMKSWREKANILERKFNEQRRLFLNANKPPKPDKKGKRGGGSKFK
ncbi:hypothetical protein BJ741DRAFT_654536 [Chytriomyces cf. hyalinus JEL632]|nr:hypothetical protein BJ741DRAFT_654536 [Chytriomyces cf. hyalinus JEL632]